MKFILHHLNPLNTFIGIFICNAILTYVLHFLLTNYFKIKFSEEIFWSAALGVSGFILIKFIEVRTKLYNTLCYIEVELTHLSNLISTLQKLIKHYIPILLPHTLPYLTMDDVKAVDRIKIFRTCYVTFEE